MKILFVTENYYPFMSGVPVVVQYLSEGLLKHHEVSVATAIEPTDSVPNVEKYNGVTIYRFKIYRNFAKKICGDLAGLQEHVINGGYDVVILECGQAATTDALLHILDKIPSKLILHSHGLSGLLARPFQLMNDFKHTVGASYNWLRMQYYYKYLFKSKLKYIDAAISLSKSDSGFKYLSKNIGKNYILGNAAEDFFFTSTGMKYDLPISNMPYLISIANYSVVKDQLSMLRQFYLTKQDKYALVMIGSNQNSYYQQLLIEKEKLDKVYGKRTVAILTEINRMHFPYLLDRASAYLVTSTCEAFSISIIEAMARSLPFISTNVGNAKELPGGVVVDNIKDFHIAIDELLSDELKCKQLGAEGKEYAYSHCRRSTAVNRLEAILKEIVS